MSNTIVIAQSKKIEQQKVNREKNCDRIYRYVCNNKDETVYSLSKRLKIPLSTTRSIVLELTEEDMVILEKRDDGIRIKKIINAKPFKERIFRNFDETVLKESAKMRELMESSLSKGYSVTIYKENDTEETIQPKKK